MRVLSYAHEPYVYLETADRTLFTEPYGPRYPRAVGRVFCLEPIQGGEYAAAHVTHVEKIEPWIFHPSIGESMLIGVEREELKNGERALCVQIISTRNGDMRRDSGQWIRISLIDR
ncbi:MAG: hypothetical protein Q8R35_00480 [bacterium]|nr:hypothetical protein [bacterium]